MKLYVGNLPYKADENDVQDWFAQAGFPVDSVSVMRDKFSGEPRGFGFVEINASGAGEMAVEACNGKELMGRALVINEARPMTPGGGGGNNRGRRGGGGRDRQRY